MSVTEFTGGVLPGGWTAAAPTGASVDPQTDYLQLTVDPGQNMDSLSSGTDSPEGPLVWRAVSGSWDFAVGLAAEACILPNQGMDLLALDDTMVDGVRLANFSGAQTGDFRSDIGWFVFASDLGTVTINTGDTLMGGLYGGPGWLRLAYDGAGGYTAYASHTGRSGSWHTIASFTSTFAPTRFALHATATPSGTDGRVQRIQRVVDLKARGTDDANTPLGAVVRSTLFSEDFSGGTLPAWLTPQIANGGTVTTDTSGAELAIDEGTLQSQAWLLGPDTLPEDHGLLVRYQLTAAGYLNAFWVPAVSVDNATDITGAQTPDDKYGPGTSLLMEMPAREHAAGGKLLRLFRRSPIRAGAAQTGSREFDGYTLQIEDADAPVSTVGTPLTWLRMERVGHWVRVRVWLDGDPEPTVWHYQAQDHTRHGTQIALTLSQNDSVSGPGTASVRFSRVEVYEASEHPVLREPVQSDRAAGADVTLVTAGTTQAGDWLVAWQEVDDHTAAEMQAPTPATWELLATADAGDGNPHVKVWRRQVTTGGAQSVTARAVQDACNHFQLAVLAGNHPPDSVDTASGSGSTHTAPSVAPESDDAWLTTAFAAAPAGDYSPPAGMGRDAETDCGAASTAALFSELLDAAGATGTRDAPYSTSGVWAAVTLALAGTPPAPLPLAGGAGWGVHV